MALAIYGLVIFPHALGHISGEVVNLVKQIEQGVNPVPVILAETILSLNFCRRKGDGQFKGCIQLFYVWMRSHFQSRQAFFTPTYRKDRYPLKEFCHGVWPSKESKEEWIITFQHLRNDEVVWKTDWMPHDSALYRCGKYLWVPLLGLWGAVSYAPMMVRRQFGSEQFVPVTHDLNQLEFTYRDKDTTKSIEAIILAWEHTRRLRQSKYVDKATQDYLEWHSCRGKSVCGLKVYGPSLPITNDPRHFQFEIEARREIAYKKLQAENEALIKENKRMKGEISSWRDEIEQSNKKVRNLKRYIRGINQKKQKRKISKLRRTVVQLKLEAQEMIEDLEEDLNIQIREYDQAREGELHLQAMVQNLNGEIQRKQDVIQTLSAECDRLLMKCESLRSTRDSYETVKAQAQHLLVEVRSVTKKAREMASAVNDLRGVIVPGNAERGQLLNLLDCLYKQLDHVGKFY